MPTRLAALLTLIPASAAFASGVTVQLSDAAGKPIQDAVVYVEAEPGQAVPKTMKPAEIAQKGLKFIPTVTVIQTGSRISFPNNDRVRHHIYSFSPAHKFDQKLYSGTTAEPQTFEKPGVVVLGCNIHDKMVAYVRVVDTPFFAKTDAKGMAQVDMPAAGGKYIVKAWHYDMVASQPAEQAVAVKAGDAMTPVAFRMPMKPPSLDNEPSPFSNY
ncbi:methylamine utilization protein [Pseudoduganella rhizocola]|uniref:methylamine utilization protein n=1 Tax=Pseudoduganella rhizocola TaxID=3382643 RepID=UPI0038B5190C